MSGLFITGTDTGVGKTELTCLIARRWRQEKRAFAVCKPIATGAFRQGRVLCAEDTQRLALAAGDDDLHAVTPYVLEEPAAPPVAAQAAGARISLEQLIQAVQDRQKAGTRLLVEGVGGLLCPLTESAVVADWVAALGYKVVIVARRSLGTLNHTLMTLEVAKNRNLEVAGIVISETTPVISLAERTNVEELRRRIRVPLLGVLPYREGGYREEISPLREIDWWSLAE